MSPLPGAGRAFDATTLRAIMPKCDASAWAGPLSAAMQEFGITTPVRRAAFLAQLAHESRELTAVSENLNYSAEGLLKTFPKYFTPETAKDYAKKPQQIANIVYSNRMGNGSPASGDGWLYRGRGPIQLTGRENYRRAEAALGCALELHPDLASDPVIGARIAAWFWASKGLNEKSDKGDFVAITKTINGGTHGLTERTALWERAKRVLGV